MKHATLRAAFLDTLPIMAGYLVLGFGFGVLLQKNGYPFYLASIMSVTIYAGSLQYAAVGLLARGAGYLTSALIALTVNARHLFYGLSMLERYRDTGRAKPYLIWALTDETYSLVSRDTLPEGIGRTRYYVLVSLLDQIYWVIGATLGGLFGQLVSFNSTGIDFSMTALFIVIFLDQWLSSRRHFPALAGVAITLACLLIFGSEQFLIPAMAGVAVVLLALRGPLFREEAHAE